MAAPVGRPGGLPIQGRCAGIDLLVHGGSPGYRLREALRDTAVLEMRALIKAANTILGRQQLVREFTPAWLQPFHWDGRYEVDNAEAFRSKAEQEIDGMFEGLGVERGGKSAKVSKKPTKSGRLDFLKKVFVS